VPSPRRRPGRAGLRLLGVLVLATAVWSAVLEPAYDRAVVATSLRVVGALARTPRIAGARFDGSDVILERTWAATSLADQRLELRTHHNNVPLLVALMLAVPGAAAPRRFRAFLVALGILAASHVAQFVLAVHWHYAVANAGTYHVDDLNVLHQPLWQAVRNGAQLRKTIVTALFEFQDHVGRLLIPVLLWMLFAPRWPMPVRRSLTTYRRTAASSASAAVAAGPTGAPS